jgi:hypothetical protein
MSFPDGREDRREASKWFGLSIIGWIIALIVAALVAVAIWGITVAISGIRGQGDAVIENNSADNWIAAQAEFEQNYAAIKADDSKITNAYNQAQTDPNNTVLQTTYAGLVSHCLTLVADYNADARSYLSEDWRAADLPEQIETEGQFANPATDCKENTE